LEGVVKYVGAWWVEVRWSDGKYESILDENLNTIEYFIPRPAKQRRTYR